MKRQLIYTICAFLLLAIAVVGSTYAFFTATTGENSNVTAEASKFEVIYTGGTEINGHMPITSDKTEAYKTSVKIKTTDDSVNTHGTLFINIEEISNNLRIEGFVWEVYEYKNSEQVYYAKGNFEGYNDTDNNIVNIVENFPIDTTEATFTLYLWIDGNKTDNGVVNGKFWGFIGANTERFTGQLSGV